MIHKMDKDKKMIVERFLSHALEIIFLLTGEEYTLVKKSSPHNSIHQLTGEVPIKCDDIAVYFSMEEWEYIEGHKERYKDMMENPQSHRSLAITPHNSSGVHDEDTETVPNSNKGEKGREIKDVQQMETHSDLRVGEGNAEIVPHVEQTVDTSVMRQQEAVEDKIQEIISLDTKDTRKEKLDSEAITEKGQHEREEDDIQQMEAQSAPYASHLKTEIAPSAKHMEEPTESESLKAQEPEVHENISPGPQDQSVYTVPSCEEEMYKQGEEDIKQEEIYPGPWLGEPESDIDIYKDCGWRAGGSPKVKPSFVPTIECGVEPHVNDSVKMEEEIIPIYIGNDVATKSNTYGQYNKSYKLNTLLNGGINTVTSCHESNNINRNIPYNNPITFMDKELNPHLDATLPKRYVSTNNDKVLGQNMQLLILRSLSRKPTKSYAKHTNDKHSNGGRSANPLSYKSQLLTSQNVHTRDKPFACFECGKSFVQRSEFIVHQRTHTGEKPFMCTECFKSFNQKSHLVRHQRIHTGEKPYECTVCGKCFSQKSHFVIHQRIHTGEKPFTCSDCGKRFISKSHLVTHQRTHPGQKTCLCPICRQSFSDRASLVLHQKIHFEDRQFTLY